MENERSMIAEDKAATEKLKNLLLKQRDVMVALTKRLGERDQEVLELQASLEATEAKLKSAEDVLDKRTAQMIRLRKRIAEKGRGWQEDDSDDCGYGNMGHETPRSSHPSEEDGSVESSSKMEGPLEVTMALQDDDVDRDADAVGVIDNHALHGGYDEDDGDLAASRLPNDVDGKDKNEDLEANRAPSPTVSDASKQAPELPPPISRDPGPSAAASSWQSEREALKTILELKVLSVIGDVATSVEGFAVDAVDDKKNTVVRQVAYLKKLVEMTVMAMTDSP